MQLHTPTVLPQSSVFQPFLLSSLLGMSRINLEVLGGYIVYLKCLLLLLHQRVCFTFFSTDPSLTYVLQFFPPNSSGRNLALIFLAQLKYRLESPSSNSPSREITSNSFDELLLLPCPCYSIPLLLFMTSVLIKLNSLISVVGFLDSVVAAKQNSARFGYSISPNRELVALGAANLTGSFIPGTLPAFGSITRYGLCCCWKLI